MTVIVSQLLTDDLHFGFEVDAAGGFGALFDDLDKIENVRRGGVAFVDDEVAMDVGHDGAADAGAFEAELIDEFAGRHNARVLENAAGAWGGGLALPTFLTETVHTLGYGFFWRLVADEDRAQGNVIFEQRTTTVLDIYFFGGLFVHMAQMIHETDRFDGFKKPGTHRAGIHAQCAPDTSRNSFEEFKAGQSTALGFD